ncbi:MAG: formylglycine-generating enzyme family protein [Deltaproteobacteria bacterium]|nr:formylglycine-generating enzyme family protein [Deltaproteobacteria bacterium]MBN2670264.1 formylglycine-generating enzyme family protein [Deltaproteobacteria bacterium]
MKNRAIVFALMFFIFFASSCKECRLASECAAGERCESNHCVGESVELTWETDSETGSLSTDWKPPLDTGSDTENDSETETTTIITGNPDLTWVNIPGGEFDMGAQEWTATQPVHTVTVEDFEMTKSEITVAQYRSCVSADVCTEPRLAGADESESTYGTPEHSDKAVNFVDWEQSSTFCEWAGGFLPSEAQWEYAARNLGQDVMYPWGDTAPEGCVESHFGWCNELIPVDACELTDGFTEQGLCEISGNVWEWIEDGWHEDYFGAPTDDTPWDAVITSFVIRGGGMTSANDATLNNRYRLGVVKTLTAFDLGFRCARFPE